MACCSFNGVPDMLNQIQVPARLQTPPGPVWYRRKMAQSRSAVIRPPILSHVAEILKLDASRPFVSGPHPDGDPEC